MAALKSLIESRRFEMAIGGMGHRLGLHGGVEGGVEGIYDRHGYLVEKREAFARLAKLVDRIVNPPDATNVIELHANSPR